VKNFYREMLYIRGTIAMALCPSVHQSQVGVLLNRINIGSHKEHNRIAQGHYFSEAKDLREIRSESNPTGAPNAGGVVQIVHFRQITGHILKTVQDRRRVSIKVE